MGIGVSVFLIALGAILTFATNYRVSGLDLDVVGIILMIAGAIGLVVYLAVWAPRRRRSTGTVVDEQRRVYDDRPPM
jgi:Trk-type K+ transport system membrane component